LNINEDVVIGGNLTVNGLQTILNTETISVDDNTIILNGITNPSDTTADEGGIILKGNEDYTLLWDKDCIHTGYGTTAAWSFNQNINVDSSLGFYIDCKIHHDQKNLLVNTRSMNNSGALYLSTNDILTSITGDWRLKTSQNVYGLQVLEFQYYDGTAWKVKNRIEPC
jgi:hypothetical protein